MPEVVLSRSAQKALSRATPEIRARLTAKLQALGEDPRMKGATQLQGLDGVWRVRVGKFRIVYAINPGSVIVETIATRGDVYKRH